MIPRYGVRHRPMSPKAPMTQEVLAMCAAQDVLDAIDHLAHRVFAGSSSSLFRREQRCILYMRRGI
jgi:hypothetical protein